MFDVGRALGERSRRSLGWSEVAARTIQHRALCRHRTIHGQRCRRQHHPRSNGRTRDQCHDQRCSARRSRDRELEFIARDHVESRRRVTCMNASEKIPTIVLGGTGYVAGELLRLIAGHPNLKLVAALSDSQPDELVAKSFAHLAPAFPALKFSSLDEIKRLVANTPNWAILSAA